MIAAVSILAHGIRCCGIGTWDLVPPFVVAVVVALALVGAPLWILWRSRRV